MLREDLRDEVLELRGVLLRVTSLLVNGFVHLAQPKVFFSRCFWKCEGGLKVGESERGVSRWLVSSFDYCTVLGSSRGALCGVEE